MDINPSKILSVRQVLEVTSLSRTTLHRLRRRGQFPPALVLSANRIGWRLVDVETWIAECDAVDAGGDEHAA